MNVTFFRANQEQVFVCLVEIEAHTTCEAVQECLFLIVCEVFVLVYNKL